MLTVGVFAAQIASKVVKIHLVYYQHPTCKLSLSRLDLAIEYEIVQFLQSKET